MIRLIQASDNSQIAAIIRKVMPEFGADGPGFAIHDPEVDHMFQAYSHPRSSYFVVEIDHRVVGGGGFAPLSGGDPHTCELRKMYFLPETRGQGIGQQVLDHCLKTAKAAGFTQCYLETLAGMDLAQKLYQKNGFEKLLAPLGKTGHFSCDRWYLKKL